jgi:hypothetical protein
MAGHRTLLWIGDPGSPGPNVVPINDMDVRVLKSLYIPGVTYALGVAAARVAGVGGGRPGAPSSSTKER